jgi:dTMP kinase
VDGRKIVDSGEGRGDARAGVRCGAGMFVTIDGQSGVGKTTVTALLGKRLEARGHSVVLTTTPSPSPIGNMARRGTFQYRGWELTLLVAADRHHHERTVIRPAVADGAVVVCDRYVASSLVLDPLDGVELDRVWTIYRNLPIPDLTIILDGDPALCTVRAAARGHYSRFHTDDIATNSRERTAFAQVAAFLRATGTRVVVYNIDTAGADEVTEHLIEIILAVKEGQA